MTVAAALILAGAGYGLFVYPDQELRGVLDEIARKMPEGATFTYKDAHFSILHRTLTLRGLSVHFRIAGETPNGANIAIDSLTVDHPAINVADRFAKLQTDPASITPETQIPIADAMILTGVRLWTDVAPLSSTTDWLGIDKLSIYPWVLLHEGLPAFSKMQAALASGTASLGALPLFQFYAAMILALRYDVYDERNLYVTLPAPPGTGLSNRSVVLGTHKLDASYKLGVQSHATLDGFIVRAAPYGTLAGAHVDLPDFDIRQSLLQLIDGGSLGPAAEKMKIGPMRFSGVSITTADQTAVPLGDAVLSRLRFDQGKLVSGALAMNSFRLSREQLCALLEGIACNGNLIQKQTTLSWRAAFTRDIDRDQLSVLDTGMDVDKLGSAALNADFVDVADGATFMGAAQLAHAELRIHGTSLVERLLAMGRSPGGTEAGGDLQWLTAARALGGQGGAGSGWDIADLANAPHDLRIALSPPQPVPFDRLRAELTAPGGMIPADLGLTVSADPP